MRDFMTKTMNVWVNQRAHGYMMMDKWAACGANEKNPFPDTKGLKVIPGFDLSVTIDLTSVSFEIPLPDGRIAVKSHSFIPEETLEVKRKTDKFDYDRWVKEGWITATPGASVDYDFVLDYTVKAFNDNGWSKGEACFDRYLATWLEYQLANRSFTPVEIPQGIPTLGVPTKDFRAKVYNLKIIHDNNPVLTWAIGNAVTTPLDKNENFMLDKGKSTNRIDPIAALLNAHVRVMAKEDKESIYEKRGMRSL